MFLFLFKLLMIPKGLKNLLGKTDFSVKVHGLPWLKIRKRVPTRSTWGSNCIYFWLAMYNDTSLRHSSLYWSHSEYVISWAHWLFFLRESHWVCLSVGGRKDTDILFSNLEIERELSTWYLCFLFSNGPALMLCEYQLITAICGSCILLGRMYIY